MLLKMSGRPTRNRVPPARLLEYETDSVAVRQQQAGHGEEAATAAVQAGQEVQPGEAGGGGAVGVPPTQPAPEI